MKQLPQSLNAWRQWPQFILCDGKMPVDVSREAIDPHNPANWMDADTAIATADLLGLQVGFVFTKDDPFWFLDGDHCIEGNQYTPIAQQLLTVFKGAAFELSTSGTGIHLFGCGEAPEHAKKNKEYGIEFYTEGRFVLLTANYADGEVWLDWGEQLQWLVDSYFRPRTDGDRTDWRDTPVDEWSGPTDDDVLIGKMLATRGSTESMFGTGVNISDLWGANVERLAQRYPTLNDKDHYDRSSADAALASHLAFWTGKNHERVLRLMLKSGLVRDKWEKHKQYLTMTITNAVNGCQNVYNNGHREQVQVTTTPAVSGAVIDPVRTSGSQFMAANQQEDYFKNCVYLIRNHGILTPNGAILKPDQFKAAYAGYTFAVDSMNEKTTKSAWEAFIDNQAVKFPRVDGVCFRPGMAPLSVVEEEGFRLVNTFVPINVRRTQGDPGIFLEHMRRLFPIQSDRDIIMAYMAAVVQHMGTKFQWCPIIQGGEGNGKTVISRVIEHAIGSRYTHYPNAADLAGNGLKFNGWIEGVGFVGIEEIYVSDRRELTEPLKVFVTNDRMEIQHKGQGQYTGDNLANIIMYSNHKDCMKMTYDQRRYFMIFTAQQTEADLNAQGMDGNYFNRLYDWLKKEDGYAIMAEYLHTYQIPDELNPATSLQRAPKSSSIHEAVTSSLGVVEQHILEAVDEGRQGFRGGWISSKCLNDLLTEIRYDSKISPQRRKTILEGLGYTRHPWLNNGRVDNPVAAEGGKSVLYFKGKLDDARVGAAEVKNQYEQAQGYLSAPGLTVVK